MKPTGTTTFIQISLKKLLCCQDIFICVGEVSENVAIDLGSGGGFNRVLQFPPAVTTG